MNINMGLLGTLPHYIEEKKYRLIKGVSVAHENKIIYERYFANFDQDTKQSIASIVKSIVSLMIGIAIEKKLIQSVNQPIGTFLESGVNKHMYHKRICIKHLLTLSSGIYWQYGIHASQPLMRRIELVENWLSVASDLPVADVPGSRFYYKDIDIYLLIEIIQCAFDMTFEEAVNKYLFIPLGIKMDSVHTNRDKKLPVIKNVLMLNNHDLQKIAGFCLNKGQLNGTQIVDLNFFQNSIKQQIDASEFQKYFQSNQYGYLWWIYEDAYFARGFGGKELAIFPDKKLSIVLQTEPLSKSREYLDVIFDLILPSFSEK